MSSIENRCLSVKLFSRLRTPLAVRRAIVVALLVVTFGISQVNVKADNVSHTYGVGIVPVSVAISSDGSTVYVSNNNSGSVSIINTFTKGVSTLFTPGLPLGLALTPDGTQLWVALSSTNSVAVYDTATLTLHAGFPANPIPVGSSPSNIAFRAGGGQAFVTNFLSNTVSVIRVNTGTVVNTVNVGVNPSGIAIAYNSTTGVNTIFVANSGSNTVSYFTPSSLVVNTIAVGTQPRDVAASPDGLEVYVTNFGSHNMSRISVGSGSVLSTIATGSNPRGLVVRPNSGGYRIYVTNQGSNTVMKINAGGTILTTISVGLNPFDIAALPTGGFAYVADAGSGTVTEISLTL